MNSCFLKVASVRGLYEVRWKRADLAVMPNHICYHHMIKMPELFLIIFWVLFFISFFFMIRLSLVIILQAIFFFQHKQFPQLWRKLFIFQHPENPSRPAGQLSLISKSNFSFTSLFILSHANSFEFYFESCVKQGLWAIEAENRAQTKLYHQQHCLMT